MVKKTLSIDRESKFAALEGSSLMKLENQQKKPQFDLGLSKKARQRARKRARQSAEGVATNGEANVIHTSSPLSSEGNLPQSTTHDPPACKKRKFDEIDESQFEGMNKNQRKRARKAHRARQAEETQGNGMSQPMKQVPMQKVPITPSQPTQATANGTSASSPTSFTTKEQQQRAESKKEITLKKKEQKQRAAENAKRRAENRKRLNRKNKDERRKKKAEEKEREEEAKEEIEKEAKEEIEKEAKEEIEKEAKEIKKYEKLLRLNKHLNKRKNKSLRQSFKDDGLDYILNAVDPEWLKQQMAYKKVSMEEEDKESDDSKEESDDSKEESDDSKEESDDSKEESDDSKEESDDSKEESDDSKEESDDSNGESDDSKEESDDSKGQSDDNEQDKQGENQQLDDDDDEELKPGWTEDIYGRLRDDKGEVIPSKPSAFQKACLKDDRNSVTVERIKFHLKRILEKEKMSEQNLQKIGNQIRGVYMNHSRAETTQALTDLILSPKASNEPIHCAMIVAILHANVGTEVGAMFIQALVQKYDALSRGDSESYDETNRGDNLILILSGLYNFNVIGSSLMYDIMKRMYGRFKVKDVELVVLLLKQISWALRKEDFETFRDFLRELQAKAYRESESFGKDKKRVEVMMEVVTNILRSNVRVLNRTDNYDPEQIQHLKKLLRIYTNNNKNNDLRMSLSDLLTAEERGKWWLVGSPWQA